jgi:hypothetical protein
MRLAEKLDWKGLNFLVPEILNILKSLDFWWRLATGGDYPFLTVARFHTSIVGMPQNRIFLK